MKKYILIFLLSTHSFVGIAQTDKQNIQSDSPFKIGTDSIVLNVEIDALLKKEYQSKKFNGNILVVQNNKILYKKSFGYADQHKKYKLSQDFKFQIGSVYKEFVAVAIMQLYEKKLIDLEDSISKYIPELPIWSKDVSVKHLLQYSSGLPEIQFQKYFPNIVTYKDVYNDILNTKNLQFKPGTSYLYTNNSPILLMKIVENVTHQTFTNYAKAYLFNSNHIEIKDKYPYSDSQQIAIPFDSEYKPDTYKLELPFLFVSNVEGLYDWFHRIHNNTLISQKSKLFLGKTANIIINQFMQSPLGVVRISQEPLSGLITIVEHTHDGSMGNYKCIARRFNTIDLSIIILTNQDNNNIYPISDEIYKIVTK
ncbi:serine hydrolase domain-containing protein [Soonwooa sp.]|uniref:serine hydrolase domain-containing protein n=1 Tax=Soonwooa sp. TaxID=1938592 RepID=UPI0028B15522|nr:serine hydrolase domain-containing protein [Soonwooa sp.]